MIRYLIDTNVLSEFFKRKPNPNILEWLSQQEFFGVSVITVDEIIYGLHFLDSVRHLKWFKSLIENRSKIFEINGAIAERSGTLRGTFKRSGVQRTQADLLIASTAYVNNLTIVTRNEKDFMECQISIFNPYSQV